MKDGESRIVGIVPNEKDGKKSYTIYAETMLEDYETERGGSGFKCVTEWTNKIDCSYLKIGDIVEFTYSKGFGGSAVLKNINVVTPAK